MMKPRPHVLGIDDAPFTKRQPQPVSIIAVMMEGADLVESVALTEFSIDGEGATHFLADWISDLRCQPALRGIFLGGITIAGLGVIDIRELSQETGLPVLAITRKNPSESELKSALIAAGFESRIAIVDRSPEAEKIGEGQFLAWAGTDRSDAIHLFRATVRKSLIPEPIRIAHLIGAALTSGESRGRV